MLFFSNFFNLNSSNIKKLEQQADSILDLGNNIKAFRLEKDIVVADLNNNKIIQRMKDTFPTNEKRACLELVKQLNLQVIPKENKKSSIWTCSFRENEARWVWYEDSKPRMTVSFVNTIEFNKTSSLDEKSFFFSAQYGTHIISLIKETSLEEVSKKINGFVLENPFVNISCNKCDKKENYTIDDLVDENKKPNYSSNFVICQHCNNLIKLT